MQALARSIKTFLRRAIAVATPSRCAVLVLLSMCLAGVSLPARASEPPLAALRPQVEQAASQFLAVLRTQPRQLWLQKAETLVRQWLSPASMARRLAGAENWSQLSEPQQAELAAEIQRTVTRYLLEAAEAYTDQGVQLDEPMQIRTARARMSMAVTGVPMRERVGATLDWQLSGQQWRITDFSVEGISYAGTKRWQYEVLWRQGGYAALYQHLKTKNDEFFAAWSQATASSPVAQGSTAGAPR